MLGFKQFLVIFLRHLFITLLICVSVAFCLLSMESEDWLTEDTYVYIFSTGHEGERKEKHEESCE